MPARVAPHHRTPRRCLGRPAARPPRWRAVRRLPRADVAAARGTDPRRPATTRRRSARDRPRSRPSRARPGGLTPQATAKPGAISATSAARRTNIGYQCVEDEKGQSGPGEAQGKDGRVREQPERSRRRSEGGERGEHQRARATPATASEKRSRSVAQAVERFTSDRSRQEHQRRQSRAGENGRRRREFDERDLDEECEAPQSEARSTSRSQARRSMPRPNGGR